MILSLSFNLICLQIIYPMLIQIAAFLLLFEVFHSENKIKELILLFFAINFELSNFIYSAAKSLPFYLYLYFDLEYQEIFIGFIFDFLKHLVFFVIHLILSLFVILNHSLYLYFTLFSYRFYLLEIMENFVFMILIPILLYY